MPRQMPPYANSLDLRVNEAIALARAGDLVLTDAATGTALRREWHVARVELLYEMAYLRIFVEWEQFLEQTFVRYLCGYRSVHGQCTAVQGKALFGRLQLAKAGMLSGNAFALWHDPTKVINRSRRFFSNGFHELVIASNVARLENLAAVRHRIVHAQEDAKRKFDDATMYFSGQRYRGARPGRFLRDWDRRIQPPRRWLETVGREMVQLAGQIA